VKPEVGVARNRACGAGCPRCTIAESFAISAIPFGR